MPGPNATITHQAIENLSGVTRCWSRWTDGSVTHSDSESRRDENTGLTSDFFVNIGMSQGMPPPAGLKWIDTVAIRGIR